MLKTIVTSGSRASDTYDRAVAEIAAKLLPVLDNLKRALDVEANVESSESDEFRHFLSVSILFQTLTGVLEAFRVKPITAGGTRLILTSTKP